MNNVSPSYKIILKNRPLSQISQRNDLNFLGNNYHLQKDEIDPQVCEERDIGKITSKLRPFSCNINIKKVEQPVLPVVTPHLIKINSAKNTPFKATHELLNNMITHINPSKYTHINDFMQSTPKQNTMIISPTINKRVLLYNQKPVTAPMIGRDNLKLVQNNNNDNNLHLKHLYNKQALEMFEKNLHQKNNLHLGNGIGNINNNNNNNINNYHYNYNLLQPFEYYNK